MNKPLTSASVPVNGLKMYYETYGQGNPLVLLHGGISASEMFGPNIAALAKNHQVIAVHLQGHGRTEDADRPLRFEQMADDVAGLLQHLGIQKADILGYSMGGGVAWQLAIRHPAAVNRLVVVSAPIAHAGYYPEVAQAFDQMEAAAPMIAGHVANSPLGKMYPGKNWETLFKKMGELNRRDYDWSADVSKIPAQTLIMFADADCVRPEHIVEIYKKLGGGQRDAGMDGSLRSPNRLAIVPNSTHYNILSTTAVADLATSFLGSTER